jgi:8-oxo-dGTP pyrophosphatase MutT (NUDIX family)
MTYTPWTSVPLEHSFADEIFGLVERYGEPLAEVAEGCDEFLHTVNMRDRPAEVCMVVRRPNGRLITSTKAFYPLETYRLPTGGVHPGESLFDALLRETQEETSLTVAVRRFLGIVRYRAADAPSDSAAGHASLQHDGLYVFATYAFLLDELGGDLHMSDPNEMVTGYREVEISELPALVTHLETLGDQVARNTMAPADVVATWRAWGAFRAVAHRIVYEALTQADEQAGG